jgi:hypothetical protein
LPVPSFDLFVELFLAATSQTLFDFQELFMGTYRHDWEIGPVSTIVTAMAAMGILQSRPNDIFPFTVSGRGGVTSIRLGVIYDLINTVGPLNNMGTGSDPVTVIAVSPLAFTFLTHAEHHRGAGQTISFECYEASGVVKLAQYGTYVSSWSHPFTSAFNLGANAGASGAWALQAHNLRLALGLASVPIRFTVW